MHLHDRAGTFASLSISIYSIFFLLYKAEKPSVRLSGPSRCYQPCQHVLKPDLLDMKAESSGTTKYVFKSLHVQLLTHMSAQKALV